MTMNYSFLPFGWYIHSAFDISAFVGVILFIAWALKLKADKQKQWMTWLLIVGILGGLLTTQFSMSGMMHGMMGNDWINNMMMNGGMMNTEMMKGGMMNLK